MFRRALVLGLAILGGATGCKPNPAPGVCSAAATAEDPVCAPSAASSAAPSASAPR